MESGPVEVSLQVGVHAPVELFFFDRGISGLAGARATVPFCNESLRLREVMPWPTVFDPPAFDQYRVELVIERDPAAVH